MTIRQRKSLGQHFLLNETAAERIVDALLEIYTAQTILEIGPGTGILSKHLLKHPKNIFFSEIDERIIRFLKEELNIDAANILAGDFLQQNLQQLPAGPLGIIGNFPYNISSQIIFKVLEAVQKVPALVGMFQKEMALRLAARHGNKNYGVITVLTQAVYSVEYLFELPPSDFDPPPAVYSAVVRLIRKPAWEFYDETIFRQLVKTAFNQRRKKLSNALASMPVAVEILHQLNFADCRAEQLSVADFIEVAKKIQYNIG
jgi:16S rRNA (adenine1518-N6/adenine1519-N6)-dimethyltransferase